ncbi:MAG: endonuclease [Flavobacteriaceae bacterium]
MKNTLILLLVPIITFAQIPTNYYLSAENNADANLKYELNQIIDNHTIFPYTSSSTDTWNILSETDRDPNNPDNVIMLYSGISINAAQEYNNTNGWTREHVWAKSRGDFGTDNGPGTDVHALRPLDANTNSTRSNRGFDNCNNCIIVYDKWGNDTGSFRDADDFSFEPRPEVKGDVARMLFYMAVRYEGYDGYVDLELSETILGVSDTSPLHGVLSTLLEWNRNDPVDSWEENRNDIIYYNYQNNRNPFIDHPELAEYIWGNKIGETWTNNSLSVEEENKVTLKLYPNPTSDFISISGLTNESEVEIYDTLGKKILVKTIESNQNKIDVSQLKPGVYLFKISESNNSTLKRVLVL